MKDLDWINTSATLLGILILGIIFLIIGDEFKINILYWLGTIITVPSSILFFITLIKIIIIDKLILGK